MLTVEVRSAPPWVMGKTTFTFWIPPLSKPMWAVPIGNVDGIKENRHRLRSSSVFMPHAGFAHGPDRPGPKQGRTKWRYATARTIFSRLRTAKAVVLIRTTAFR